MSGFEWPILNVSVVITTFIYLYFQLVLRVFLNILSFPFSLHYYVKLLRYFFYALLVVFSNSYFCWSFISRHVWFGLVSSRIFVFVRNGSYCLLIISQEAIQLKRTNNNVQLDVYFHTGLYDYVYGVHKKFCHCGMKIISLKAIKSHHEISHRDG